MPLVVRSSIIGGLVFTYLIALAKIALYFFGLIYLQKKHIRGLFRSPAIGCSWLLAPDSWPLTP